MFSGSASTRVTKIENNYATTGSNSFRADQSITGSLVVSSTITAQTLVVQTVTSSIVYSSGSNLFGSALGDRQTFTGSVNITGSLALAGNITSNGTAVVLGSGTSSYLPKFTGTSTIGNSIVNDNGTGIGIGIAAASPFILNTLSTDATTSGVIGIMQIGRASSGTAANGIGGNLQFTAQDTAGTQRTAAYITWKLAVASSASPQGYLSIGTRNASEALIITDSGNLGLGVTPSAWGSGYTALQIPSGTYGGGSFFSDNGSPAISANAYNNSGWKYVNTDYATIYQSRSGQHQWYNAPSGTAGNAITFTQAMTLTAAGNLGIGTTAPTEKLTVYGAVIRLEGTSATGITPFAIANNTTDGIRFYDYNAAATRMSITGSTGYVGINNTAPLDRLDVAGNIRATVNTSYFTTFGYTGGTLIRMVTPSAETADNMVFKIDGASSGTAGNQFIFQTQSGNTTPVTTLSINKLGDVSIGTTTSTKYQVLNLINDANTAGAAIGLARSAGQFITNAGAGDLVIGNATGKNILFGNTGAGTTEYARITSGGLVGIGTVPLSGQKLIVNIASNQNIRFSSEGGQATISGVNGDATAFGMLNIDANVLRLQSNASGNVSIGTATDFGYKLNLNGQPGANGYTAWTNWSDSRLKENVTDLEVTNVLDKINRIRPVTYNYNELSGFDEATRARRISGFIAQELMEVFPDMVGTITKDDIEYYDTNLSNLNLYLVKAIQELKATNDDLQTQINELKAR
jgi:hypothetical protein